MLNALDAQQHVNSALAAVKAQLTSDPRFVGDEITRPGALRERLLDLLGQFSSSFQAPTASQIEEAGALKQLYDDLSVKYRGSQ
jgi:hypothetical protein